MKTSQQLQTTSVSANTELAREIAAAESRDGSGQYFGEIVRDRFERRAFVKGAGLVGVGLALRSTALTPRAAHASGDPGAHLTFTPVPPTNLDAIVLAPGYIHDVVIRWGDPIRPAGPVFDLHNQSKVRQELQFGFNCDFVAQLPLPAWLEKQVAWLGRPTAFSAWLLGITFPHLRRTTSPRALLWVNHEYTTGGDMFPGYDASNPTQAQVDTELAAHGGSILGLHQDTGGRWVFDIASPFNRRITGETQIELSGPLAGHALVQTSADPTGRKVRGMLNNCGGGITPWGTILSAEENFDQYFANGSALDPAKAAFYARLAPPSGASERKWERFHARFDLAAEPNEYARFGYIVEVDPYDPTSVPKKRTALGRFKHEAAVPTVARDKRVVIYSGDDARFEYVYKFVTTGRFHAHDRAGNLDLLDSGALYVAKFSADGSGTWLPLVHGQGPLTATNGFPSQAEVLLNPRAAADRLGATKMDRPEDVEVSPVTGKVYVACTNNSKRTAVAVDPGEVAANPRLGNRWGHVVEITEDGGDNAAMTFRWEIFLLCGDPALPQGTYFAGFDPSRVSPLSCPDNLDFDEAGNLWIATDGATASPGFELRNDGIFAVPTEGSDRGFVRQFLSGPAGCEVASLKLSTDGRALFATIQHPGEGMGIPNGQSSWPDGNNSPPRPSVVAVRHTQNRRIGR